MIKPSIGRSVWYRPVHSDGGLDRFIGPEPLAAIVTAVWDERTVNLCVFDPTGLPHGRVRVPLRQEDDIVPPWAHCEWMPYQIDQAKKHEDDKSA